MVFFNEPLKRDRFAKRALHRCFREKPLFLRRVVRFRLFVGISTHAPLAGRDLWLIDLIIDSTEGNVGIPIGNQTSQLFALLYLDGLDHFVKEKLGIKYYGRYMDDFFLIHHDKAYLQECRKQIEAFVQARGLSLNAKTNIFPLKHGVDFLGFHTYLTENGAVIRKVRRRSKNNMKRKLKKLAALHAAGRIDAKTVEQSYQSWRGHAEKGNSYHLIRRTDHYYNSLMKSKEAAQCQKH